MKKLAKLFKTSCLVVTLCSAFSSSANIYSWQEKLVNFSSENAHFALIGMGDSSVLAHENTVFSMPIAQFNTLGKRLEALSDNRAVSVSFSQEALLVYVNEVDEDIAVTVRVVDAFNVMDTAFSFTINVVNKPTLAIDNFGGPQFASKNIGDIIVGDTEQWLTAFVEPTFFGGFNRGGESVAQWPVASNQVNLSSNLSIATGNDTPVTGQYLPSQPAFTQLAAFHLVDANIDASFRSDSTTTEDYVAASAPLALLKLGQEKAKALLAQPRQLFATVDSDNNSPEQSEQTDDLFNTNDERQHQGSDSSAGPDVVDQEQEDGRGDLDEEGDEFVNVDEPFEQQSQQNQEKQAENSNGYDYKTASNFTEQEQESDNPLLANNVEVVKVPEPNSFILMIVAMLAGIFAWRIKPVK